MQSRSYVSPKNGSAIYETYCQVVEDLALRLELTPEETEQCLFSRGGRKPDPWRELVKTE